MALIKCEECGQMVSDKASACPHCGCPVKVQMVCPECGEAVTEGDSYCLKCGCPLNHNPQPQVEEQADYSWEDDEEKPNNTLKWLLGVLAALIVLGGVGLYAWQSGMFNKTEALEDTVAVDSTPTMAAPVIELIVEIILCLLSCYLLRIDTFIKDESVGCTVYHFHHRFFGSLKNTCRKHRRDAVGVDYRISYKADHLLFSKPRLFSDHGDHLFILPLADILKVIWLAQRILAQIQELKKIRFLERHLYIRSAKEFKALEFILKI